jgi:hypothetical protein
MGRWLHRLVERRNFCKAKDKEGAAGKQSSRYQSHQGDKYATPDSTRGRVDDGPLRFDHRRLFMLCWAARASNVLTGPTSVTCRDEDARSNRVISKKSCLRRAFVSRLNSVLLGHVFTLRRPAVKRRAFDVVNACFCVNPYQAMSSARRLRVSRLLRRASRGR